MPKRRRPSPPTGPKASGVSRTRLGLEAGMREQRAVLGPVEEGGLERRRR